MRINNKQMLTDHGNRVGRHIVADLLDAGLAVQSEDGSLRDKFRERVMFPIHSLSGRVIAYSGRTLRSDNPAKYVNSPETDIYIKSRNLLGIYFAKSEISRLDKCILVEGNIDMVMMHQLGICNVVASCGTSLTIEQIRLIHKFTDNLTIMYDGDSAGIHAALRGITMVLSEGMNVKIVMMPEGDDPDSFSRRHTLEEVQRFIETSEKDFIAFKTDLLLSEAAGDPLKKANLIIVCKSASDNTKKQADKFASRFHCPIIETVTNTLEELTFKGNAKVMAIADQALASAVLENIQDDFIARN
jgi:DNA primase catalytic core